MCFTDCRLTSERICEFALESRLTSARSSRILSAPPELSTSSAFLSSEGGSPTGRSRAWIDPGRLRDCNVLSRCEWIFATAQHRELTSQRRRPSLLASRLDPEPPCLSGRHRCLKRSTYDKQKDQDSLSAKCTPYGTSALNRGAVPARPPINHATGSEISVGVTSLTIPAPTIGASCVAGGMGDTYTRSLSRTARSKADFTAPCRFYDSCVRSSRGRLHAP